MALTEPTVPTGMKMGVGMTPWAVRSSPARAAPSVCCSVKTGSDMARSLSASAPRCKARRTPARTAPLEAANVYT